MIRASVLYPNVEGSRFDLEYYLGKHIPLVQRRVGAACKEVKVDFGLGGAAPGSKPPFVAMVHMLFDSLESFQQNFGPHLAEFGADIPNYTDIEPVIQISEAKM